MKSAAWAITGHVFLQHAVFGDALLQLAHRVGRLAGLATPRADED
jgi:hypothetical protein